MGTTGGGGGGGGGALGLPAVGLGYERRARETPESRGGADACDHHATDLGGGHGD
jgi:hypothetical protein